MAKLILKATGPIRLDRDVAGGEVLATIDTEHNLATLLVMVQQRQAEIIVDGEDKPKAKAKEKAVTSERTGANTLPENAEGNPTFAQRLDEAGVTDKQIELLAEAGIVDVESLTQYFDDEAKIAGIGDSTNEKLRELLG